MVVLAPSLAAALLAVVQTSDSLTLEQALARARAARPQVTAAAAAVARARGTRRIATMVPNPSAQYETDEQSYTRKLMVEQPLAWLPRYGAERAGGRALVERAAADSAQLVSELGRDVRRAFFGALAAEQALRLSTDQVQIADSVLVLADRRVGAGDISELERDQVAQESSRARLAALRAREVAALARAELARAVAWTGEVGGAELHPVGALDAGLDAVGELLAVTPAGRAPNEILAQLPALRAVVADSAGSAARLRAARLAQIPIPAIVVGREWGGDPTLRNNAILGLSIPFPLWSQGREAVAEARGAADESTARLAEARLTISAQLEGAHIRVTESAARARFARDTLLPEARRIRAGAVRLYDAGRTGIFPVFDALRVERDVSQTVLQELLAFQDARAELLARLGRWQ